MTYHIETGNIVNTIKKAPVPTNDLQSHFCFLNMKYMMHLMMNRKSQTDQVSL